MKYGRVGLMACVLFAGNECDRCEEEYPNNINIRERIGDLAGFLK